MDTHSTRFGLNLVVQGSVAQTVAEAKRAAGSAPATYYQGGARGYIDYPAAAAAAV
jgi:hypothetical protein